MKTYVFQPIEHGPVSFIVMAGSETDARQAVEAKLTAWATVSPDDEDEREYQGQFTETSWRQGKYRLTILEPLQVLTNAND